MLPILIITALVALLSTNAFLSRRAKKRRGPEAPRVDPSTMAIVERVWMDVAEARGMHVDEAAALAIRGDIEGVPCEIELSENYEGLVTVARAHRIPEAKAELSVSPLDLREKARLALRGKRSETGDADFDKAFVCTANPADLLKSVLDESTRELLFLLQMRAPRLSYDGSTVELTMNGAEIVHEHIEGVLDLLARIAKI